MLTIATAVLPRSVRRTLTTAAPFFTEAPTDGAVPCQSTCGFTAELQPFGSPNR